MVPIYLINLLLDHNLLTFRFVQNVQDIFGPTLFYLFVISSWILCTTAYRVVHVSIGVILSAVLLVFTDLPIYCKFLFADGSSFCTIRVADYVHDLHIIRAFLVLLLW